MGTLSVNDRKTCRLADHCGWNAMPSNPPSEFELTVSAMKLLAVGVAVFANTRTVPPFCTTNQRESSPGACNIATGWSNVRFGNARCNWIAVPVTTVFAGATHERFDGRESKPTVTPGGGGGV